MASLIRNRHFMLLILPIHILFGVAFYMLISGQVRSIDFLFAFVGWFLVGGLGIAVGYHRLLSHGSFQTGRLGLAVLTYLGCLGGQGSPLLWAALHRGAHHPYADRDEDPHSPEKGWFYSYMSWQFHVQARDVKIKSVADLLKDPLLRFFHSNYEKVVWISALLLFLINWRIALFGLCVPMFVSMHLDNLVNLLCHIRSCGYRNFETPDNSVNIPLLGWFNFGGGWHNNHHAHPGRYNFGGERWFEFDPCVFLVPFFAKRKTHLKDEPPKTSDKTESLPGHK